MIRLALFVLFGAAVLAVLLHISIWITLVPLAAFVIYAYTAGGLKTRCPDCRKRFKVGATSCHHCGHNLHSEPKVVDPVERHFH